MAELPTVPACGGYCDKTFEGNKKIKLISKIKN
jgi:hypothetical protein